MTGCVQYCKKDQLIRLILVKSQKFEKKKIIILTFCSE